MAILTGINTRMRGSVGEWTFARNKSKTIAKQKVEKKQNPSRSYAQMAHRVRMANIVNMWKAFFGKDKPSFESKPGSWSDYNAFMNANLQGDAVYLTKTEANQGGCVAAGYCITSGSLPAISVTEGTGGFPVTDISLGNLAIDGDTTLAEFSQAVVDNNDSFQHLDQISCFIVKQSQNTATGVPYVAVKALEVTLNLNATDTLLADVVDADGFASVNGKLGRNSTINGAITWVHSRKSARGVQVSSQSLFVSNSLLSQYQSATKRSEAILSYGGSTTADFLAPNIDEAVAAD
ncbi:MAG: hypothetical protein IJK84_04155 [Bacteroidales bacterium]|nr:hypothetical protein [Bacteroidales bacterium]